MRGCSLDFSSSGMDRVPLPDLGIELQLYIFVGKEIGKKLIGKN